MTDPEKLTDEEQWSHDEMQWSAGNRAAWVSLLGMAIKELRGEEGVDLSAAILLSEREQAVAALRELCKDFGDNDWKPNLHLADVLNRHLGNHLYAARNDEPKEPTP